VVSSVVLGLFLLAHALQRSFTALDEKSMSHLRFWVHSAHMEYSAVAGMAP
jgi:hypothetical protein